MSLTKGRNFSGEQMFTLHLRHIMEGWSHNGGKGWSTFAPSRIMGAEVGVVGASQLLRAKQNHKGKAEDMKTELQACKTLAMEKSDGYLYHKERVHCEIPYSFVCM